MDIAGDLFHRKSLKSTFLSYYYNNNWLNYYVYQETPYEFINTADILGK